MTLLPVKTVGSDTVEYDTDTRRIKVTIGGATYWTPLAARGFGTPLFFQPSPLVVAELDGSKRRILSTGSPAPFAAAPAGFKGTALAGSSYAPPSTGVDWTFSCDGVETGRATETADGSNSYILTSENSRRFFETDATQVDVEVYVTETSFTDGNSSRIALYVPSAAQWATSALPGATGIRTLRITVPGSGLRMVWAYDAAYRTANELGVWIRKVTPVDGTICRLAAVPSSAGCKALIFYNDSLPHVVDSGGASPSTFVARDSFSGQLRLLPNTRVYHYGWGGATQQGATTRQKIAYWLAGAYYAAGCGAANSRIIIALGKNEWLQAALPDAGTQAAWRAGWVDMIQKVRALVPSTVQIDLWGVLPSLVGATNGAGQTQAPYITAIQGAVTDAADAKCSFVDTSAFYNPTTGLQADGTHLNVTGHTAVKNALVSLYALT